MSQRKDRQGDAKDYGEADVLKNVFFNPRSIVKKADDVRVWIGAWECDAGPL